MTEGFKGLLKELAKTSKGKKVILRDERQRFAERLRILTLNLPPLYYVVEKEDFINDIFEEIEIFLNLIPCEKEGQASLRRILSKNKFEILDV